MVHCPTCGAALTVPVHVTHLGPRAYSVELDPAEVWAHSICVGIIRAG